VVDLGERLHDFLPSTEGHPFHRREPVFDITVKLHEEYRLARLGIQIEQVTGDFEFPLSFGLIEKHAINVFDRRRLQFQQFRRSLHGLGNRIEENQSQPNFVGRRDEFQFGGNDRRERAFAAGRIWIKLSGSRTARSAIAGLYQSAASARRFQA
jgi:hypothetical protein